MTALRSRTPGTRTSARVLALGGSLALALALGACSTSTTEAPEDPQLAGTSAPAESGADDSADDASAESGDVDSDTGLAFEDGWIKAADSGMTGAFGTLVNTSDEDVTVTAATAEVAGMTELHETENSGGSSTMKEKEGGFTVPAGGSLEFAPGGDHIMLMDLQEEILPGDEVAIELETSAGPLALELVAKDYTGAQETYAPEDSAGSHDAAEDGGSESDSDDHANHDMRDMSGGSANDDTDDAHTDH